MPRWSPDARARLVAAAIELFSERGYDRATVTDIVERAGLSKATFFRYFPDKREVLAAGQEALGRLLAEGIDEAPDGATPLAAVRAGLARAMALDPEILFFDEPSAGLDPITSASLDNLILNLNAALGTTMIVVTHELDSINTIAQKALMLDREAKGKIAFGTIDEVRNSTAHPRIQHFFQRIAEE